jgi:hypothetical protein
MRKQGVQNQKKPLLVRRHNNTSVARINEIAETKEFGLCLQSLHQPNVAVVSAEANFLS